MKKVLMAVLVAVLVAVMVIGLTGVGIAGEKEDITSKLTDMQKKADKIMEQKVTAGCAVYEAELQQLQVQAKPLVDRLNEIEKEGKKK